MSYFEKVAIGVVEVDARLGFVYLHIPVGQSMFDRCDFVLGCAECQMRIVVLSDRKSVV